MLKIKQSQDKDHDPLKHLINICRDKKGVPFASAKLEVDEEIRYVEFFRGKDFARFFRENPAKLEPIAHLIKASGKTVDEQIGDFIQYLLKKKIIWNTERKFKKPKPGKKKLVKFPKSLVLVREQTWSEDAFYAWTRDRPATMWFYLGAVALPVVVIAACLFPLAPYVVRMYTLYSMVALLSLILGLLAVRYSVFALFWILTGSYFWILPNLMNEDVPVMEAFTPLFSYERPEKSQVLSRIASAIVLSTCVFLLYHNSPDQQAISSGAKKAHDSVLEFLAQHKQGKASIAGSGSGDPTKPPPR